MNHCKQAVLIFPLLLGLSALVGESSAQSGEDVPGSRDHRLIPRYADAVIIHYDAREFDEYRLILGPVEREDQPEHAQDIEGRVFRISYEIPRERTTLEVFRNYEQALAEAGFEILFDCRNRDCGPAAFGYTLRPVPTTLFTGHYDDQRYLAARLSGAEEEVYAALYVVKAYGIGGPRKDNVFVSLDVVERQAMEHRMITAEAMAEDIFEAGSVAIYDIYFDFDQAKLKPESEPAITEIAKLLESEPGLNLFVVGHTDNQGDLEYNSDLSLRRARAVVQSLTTGHGIDVSRLEAKGLAFLAPVASNRTEAGRAMNRRVALVER